MQVPKPGNTPTLTWAKTRVSARLGIKYPIIQGPLGGLSSQRLTAAVSNYGGLGSFGAHGLSPSAIKDVIAELRSMTDKPFAMNLWVSMEDEGAKASDETAFNRSLAALAPHIRSLGGTLPSYSPYSPMKFEEQVRVLIDAKVPAFSFIYGIPPKEILDECRAKGIVMIGTATTPDEAVELQKANVDVIAASGFEAGGHRGSFLRTSEDSLTGTFSLVPQVVDVVSAPVVAAGGIADARGIRAAFALGAEGVQIGTAFLACEESGAARQHREALLSGEAAKTALTRGFTGRLGRAIKNQLLDTMNAPGVKILPYPLQRFLMRYISAPAEKAGKPEFIPMWAGQSADAILKQLRKRLSSEIPDGRVLLFGPPAVRGLGNAGGFKLMVEATGNADLDQLQAAADDLAAKGMQQPGMAGMFSSFRARTPQLYVDVNREKVKTMGVPLTDVFDALQADLGSYYVNDFNRFGRTWQVNVEADAGFRDKADDIRQIKVRNADGDMVPLGAVGTVRDSAGPAQIIRYNMFPAAAINGASLSGTSTGDLISTMEGLAGRELPAGMATEWSDLMFLQKESSKIEQIRDLQQNPISAFVMGSLLVFFVLAGLYENWSLPLAVILVVPMCLLSAMAGIWMAHMDIDIFVQVAFVVLVGLACKNAILIVEFARDRQLEGANRSDAAVDAARVRLRPILMTSFAFILGVFPLVIAQGAGAEMRRTLGTAVFAGMIGVTFFGIFLTPVFYYVIRGLSPARKRVNGVPVAGDALPNRSAIPVTTASPDGDHAS